MASGKEASQLLEKKDLIRNQIAYKSIMICSAVMLPIMISISFISYLSIPETLFSYVPAILVCLSGLYKCVFRRIDTNYLIYLDALMMTIPLGGMANEFWVKFYEFPNTQDPMLLALAVGTAITGRRVLGTYLRNTIYMVLFGILASSVLGASKAIFLQIVTGYGIGLVVALVWAMAKEFLINRKIETESAEKTSRESLAKNAILARELSKALMPHQIELVLLGFPKSETMPTTPKEAFASKFDIVSSSKFQLAGKQKIYNALFADCRERLREGYRHNVPDAASLNLGADSFDELQLESLGFQINTVGDGFFTSYGYPLGFLPDRPICRTIMNNLLKNFVLFESHLSRFEDAKLLSAVQSLTFGRLEGSFSGTTNSYSVGGDAVIEAERLESARKIPEAHLFLEKRLKNGHYGILLSEEAHAKFAIDMPAFLKKHFEKFSFSHPIRDMKSGGHIYIWLFKREELSVIYEDFQAQNQERLAS